MSNSPDPDQLSKTDDIKIKLKTLSTETNSKSSHFQSWKQNVWSLIIVSTTYRLIHNSHSSSATGLINELMNCFGSGTWFQLLRSDWMFTPSVLGSHSCIKASLWFHLFIICSNRHLPHVVFAETEHVHCQPPHSKTSATSCLRWRHYSEFLPITGLVNTWMTIPCISFFFMNWGGGGVTEEELPVFDSLILS